jgi:hypothetical protein
MIQLKRPPKPPGYPPKKITDEKVRLANGAPIDDAKPHWQDFKRDFLVAQHHKCAWCETPNTEYPGAVDHFAPKGEIGVLLEHGTEVPDRVNVEDRKIDPLHASGYVHLCYEWDNWLFSCERCNTGWKRTLFPVEEYPHPNPMGGEAYTPLLLNPFQDPDPEEHLDYDSNGQIKPRAGSTRGKATIATLGLDRESLRRERERVRKTVEYLVMLIEDLAENNADALDRLRAQFDSHASPECRYAAVARAVIREELGYTWDEFQRKVRGSG